MIAETSMASYGATAKTLHWLMAAAILVSLPIGISLEHLPEGPIQDTMYDLHRSFGAVILLLAVLRLANRAIVGAPPPDPGLTPLERGLSKIVHVLLYVLMIAVPIGGWAATSAYGAPVTVFWLFELPPLVAKDEHLSDTLFALHKAGGLAFGALILLHIAGAVKHGMKGDGVLARMLPAR